MTAGDVALPPQIQIRKFDCLALGNAEPPVHARRFREAGLILALTTSPRIHGLIIPIIRSARRLRQILARANARIEKPALPQPSPSLQIVRPALTLRVRGTRAATFRPLTPANSQPAQVFGHGADNLRPRALRIQILIPQNQGSLILDRPLRRDPERPRMTNVQQPRRRRRQASAITRRGLRHKRILAGPWVPHSSRSLR